MGLEVWGGIGLFALVLEVVTLSGFFLAVTVGAVLAPWPSCSARSHLAR